MGAGRVRAPRDLGRAVCDHARRPALSLWRQRRAIWNCLSVAVRYPTAFHIPMRALLLLSFVLLASASGAQTVEDTTSASRYVPLHVGDAWEYKVFLQYGVQGLIYRYSMTREIEADTTVDSRNYVVVQERTRDVRAPWTYTLPEDRRFMARYDDASARLVTREIGSAEEQFAPCQLNSSFPSHPETSAEVECGDGEMRVVSGGYAQEVYVWGTGPYTLTAKTLTNPAPLQIEGLYERWRPTRPASDF